MKHVFRFMLLGLAVFSLAACQQAAEPAAVADLAGTSWEMSSLNGRLPLADATVSLEFGTDGTVGGSDGCNRFATGYTQDGADFTISQPAASTMMACPEPIMEQAAAFMTTLTSVTAVSVAGNQLSLLAGDQIVATFVTASGATEPGTGPELVETGLELAGTGWVLSSKNGALPIAGTAASIQFGTDGSLSGTDGCNTFNTTFSQDNNSLTIAESGASTMMACPEPVMAQAADFMAGLVAADSFILDDDSLTLVSGGAATLTFVAQSSDLLDTAWEVTSYNNGREAVVGLIAGTEITANFGVDGELTGNAGCNQFFTSFAAADGTIETDVIGTTLRFCDEPPGVMEQESEFLAALASATTYDLVGNQLYLRTAADQLAVVMTRIFVIDLPEPEAAEPTGRVIAPQGMNIRSGPGVNFPVIGSAQFGDEGEIVGRDASNRWWAAAVPSAPDGIGWLSAEFILATGAEDVPVLEVAPPVIMVPTAAPTPTPPPPPTATPAPTLSFGADRTSINQGDCTTLRWSVENIQAVWVYPQGETFNRFPRAGQGTEQVCPTATTTYEMRVLQRDGAVVFRQVTIEVSGAAPNPLAGSRWEVVNYDNGRGGLVSVLPGTRLTMEFGTDGSLVGNSGCNTYTTTYRINGSNITIDRPGSTQLACSEPEGIMDQEAEFQSALSSARAFRLDGNTLEIRSAGSQIAVLANRIP